MPPRSLLSNVIRFVHAVATDQVAHFAPSLYVRMTGQTGRGAAEETPAEIADYFFRCFDEYFKMLRVPQTEISQFLGNKHLLEYGPGDLPGVALLMLAYGAESVVCVDRFPLVSLSAKNHKVLQQLLERLPAAERAKADSCFKLSGDPTSGFKETRLRYMVRPSGLSGLCKAVDLIYSRAVLEHVNDLETTFSDMHSALRPGGICIHQVDLKSHGPHRTNPLDFLAWPQWMWALMYGHKGMPNRWRINGYRMALAEAGFKIDLLEPTLLAAQSDINNVRQQLARAFRELSDEDLSCLGFWLICR